MGQKVHPIGFRVGITKRHQSQWFARFTKHAYAQSILEDRMLRNTLISFATEALNSNTAKKRDSSNQPMNPSSTPKITHIKIERGLIPYEIGIQIHADNCHKFKSSLNNLKINLSTFNKGAASSAESKLGGVVATSTQSTGAVHGVRRDLLCKLQKTRRYLISLGMGMVTRTKKNADVNQNLKQNDPNAASLLAHKGHSVKKGDISSLQPAKKKVYFFNLSTFNRKISTAVRSKPLASGAPSFYNPQKDGTKVNLKNSFKNSLGQSKKRKKVNYLSLVYKKKKIILKRLRKRQEIRRRYRRLMLKGLFVQKKGKINFLKTSFFLRKS